MGKPVRPASPSAHGLRSGRPLVRSDLAQPVPRPRTRRLWPRDFSAPTAARPALARPKRHTTRPATADQGSQASPGASFRATRPWLGQHLDHPCVFFADQGFHGQPRPWSWADGRWPGQAPGPTPRPSPTGPASFWKSALVFRRLPYSILPSPSAYPGAEVRENPLHFPTSPSPNDGVSGTAAPSNHHGRQGIFARSAPRLAHGEAVSVAR